MKRRLKTTKIALVLILAAVFTFSVFAVAYWRPQPAPISQNAHETVPLPGAEVPAAAAPVVPQPADETPYSGTDAQSGMQWALDVSGSPKGYVYAYCVTTGEDGRCAIRKDGAENLSHLPGDGEYQCLPLTRGNGRYTIILYLPAGEDLFWEVFTLELDVMLEDERLPFLIPGQVVRYDESSAVVLFAQQFAAATPEETVSNAYDWICDNITYDESHLPEDGGYYLPDLDRILTTKTGECYDIAALLAACLRINGIPCQLVTGDLTYEDGHVLYHAWNLVWQEDGKWERMDATLSLSSHISRRFDTYAPARTYRYGPAKYIF